MIKALSIVISIVPFLFIYYYSKKQNLFSPGGLYSIFYIVRIVPMSILIAFNQYSLLSTEKLIPNTIIQDEVIQTIFFLLQIITYIIVILVLWNTSERFTKISILHKNNRVLHRRIKILSYIIIVIGLFSFTIVMIRVGGINNFFNNLNLRTILLKKAGIFKYGISFLSFAPLVYLYSYKYTSKKNVSFVFWIVTIILGILAGLGGRKDIIFILFKSIVFYHFFVKKIKLKELISLRNMLIVIMISVIIIVFPQLRKENGLDLFLNNPSDFLSSFSSNIFNILSSFSYINIYLFIIGTFSYSNFWFGKNFLGLLYAFIPSSIYGNKPPVDDGMYIYSLALGRTGIEPLMKTSDLDLTSYPLETFGSMYANFGAIGVILGFVILSLIIRKNSSIFIRQPNFFTLNFYLLSLMTLELSTLRIIQFIYSTFICYFVYVLIRIIEKSHNESV